MDYFEKKKTMEEKEKFFIDEMERGSKLISERKYDEGVKVLMALMPVCDELQWNDKKAMIKDLVYDAREKEKSMAAEEKHRQSILDKKQQVTSTYNEALDLMGNAAEKFEKKDWDASIKLYHDSLVLLGKINATREIQIVEDAIQRAERKKSEMLRAAGTVKTEPVTTDVASIEAHLKKEGTTQDQAMARVKAIQDKKARETKLVDEAMAILDKANAELKDASSLNFVSADAKKERYDQVISLYEDAAAKFNELGWTSEASKVKDTVIKVKKDRDASLDALARKLAAAQGKIAAAQEPMTGLAAAAEIAREKHDIVAKEILEKKKEQQRQRDAAFAALDAAASALDAFNKKSKILGGQLFKENEYPELVRMYRKALDLFKEANWLSEAAKIEESIEILRREEKEFLVEKAAFEAKEGEASKRASSIPRTPAISKQYQRDVALQAKLETRQKEKESVRADIDRSLDLGIHHYNRLEYAQSELYYLRAYDLMMENGWENEASTVMDTVKMIREKREAREKLLNSKERAIEDAGQFTRGVEQIYDTMDVIKKQEDKETSTDKQRRLLEQKAQKQRQEEEYFAVLGRAQEALNNRQYAVAIENYNLALPIARELNWASQVRDLEDFIQLAEKKQRFDDLRANERVKTAEARDLSAFEARSAAVEPVIDDKGKEPVLTQRQRDKLVGDEAFALLDDANALLRNGHREEAIRVFKNAMNKFETIGWTREKDAVVQQVKNIERDMEKEKVAASKEMEAVKTRKAYDAINEAERCLRNKQADEAMTCYVGALNVFEEVGWSKEATMVRNQIEKLKADLGKKLVAETVDTEKTRSDRGFALLDDARKFQNDRKIFKAVECARQALDVFTSLGDKWAREIGMVQKFVDDLEREKAKKEELIKKLTSGEL